MSCFWSQSTRVACYDMIIIHQQDGLLQMSVDTGQASRLHHSLRMEVTWKENVRQVRQEGVRSERTLCSVIMR